jgi:simple sugar transport system ATP-binding protein
VPAAASSGGNQQKLVLGRTLAQRPRVLVAENPTRGLDIHATELVHAQLRRAAAGGAGILIYSSDLDEVLALADRVVVMSAGELMAAAPRADRAAVGQLMVRGGQP